MKLVIEDLHCGYGTKEVVGPVSLTIQEAEIVCLLGPNGVGKTTFFKTVLGFLKPLGGTIHIDGVDMATLPRRELAKLIAYVPQACNVPFAFTVEDVVTMGRYARIGHFSAPTQEDRECARAAMEELGISHLQAKVYTRLSGGERQMTLIARALCQNPKLLVLDEPTSNLDFGNQVRILNQIQKLRKRGTAVLMTTHAPDQVFLCGTRVIVFKGGKCAESGIPRSVMTENLLGNVYGVKVVVRDMDVTEEDRVKICVPCL